jgi:hypothetical protein
MKRILMTIIFTSLIASACNLQIVSDSQPEVNTPAFTTAPTETAAPSATPTESAPLASATPEFAPICTADSASVSPAAQCQLPTAVDSSAFCEKKDSYNLIFVSKGSTFQAITKGYTCRDAGMKNDQQMVTCTGQMATNYQVEVCNPACVVPTVQAAITTCPKEYNYNALQGCCTQGLVTVPQSCVVLELKSTTCMVNCKEYNKKKTCDKNSVACIWNDQARVCQLRK